MPVYQYRALKESGVPAEGVVDADSPREARTKLRAQRLHVTDLTPLIDVGGGGGPAAGTAAAAVARPLLRGRNLGEIAMATRQLATLLNAGIPLAQALSALIEQSDSRALEASLRDVRERVQQGTNFADALAKNPRYFDDLYVNMVRAGEASGNLDGVLMRIADYIQAQNRLRAKIMAALTYPIIRCVIGIGVIIFLLGFVVPQITRVLLEQKKALPLPTELLIMTCDFLKMYWWALVAAVLGAYLLFKLIIATEAGRLGWDTFRLQVPIVGPLFKKQAVSRFASTFATLLESGLPALEALNIVKTVMENVLLENTLENVRTRIIEGADISSPLKKSKVFPPAVCYMIAVGEESGKLEELLRKVSESYDEEIEITSQKVTALLEPVMIIGMAGVVGFIVLSILLPILEMSKIG
ncbi:MAG: type II secretion system inner membrane protein GspF [Planctomycetes bacterium]|nr:type II secretion system inner membrane protein GspF [Planctomycetota bacterium]